jgi:hypothetical protein
MKQKLLLHCIIFSSLSLSFKASAQNADELVFNQYLAQYSYVAGSFLIDSGTSQNNSQKRAFLIWANNLQPDSLKRNLSLSEYNGGLDFLTEQGNTTEKLGSVKNMFPKKIIKSRFERAYYLLAYVTNSSHKISGFNVFSSPVVFKINAVTLTPVWVSKINLAVLSPNNLSTVIEYNDMIETSDKNIVLVGKNALSTTAKESVLATKLRGSTGSLMWRYVYKTGNNCNEAANSVAETRDGRLSLTGYVKKCVNADVFYMQLQSTGIPVPGVYVRFFWPTNLNIWGDKITRYTSSAGNDRLIISGYVDVLTATGATDRQILIMNLKQSGNLITAQHIGNPTSDVCNDLIFKKTGKTGNDYLIYLTGQTVLATTNAVGQAYFLYAKFNDSTGVTGLSEFSTFPNSTYPNGSRNGIEIKNAGNYKKFAILATGFYQPVPGAAVTTFSNVLVRDFADTSGKCINKQKTPIKQFNLDRTFATVAIDTPLLKTYRETWIKLEKLNVKEPCQHIKVDPSEAQNLQPEKRDVPVAAQVLRVTPNPAQSVIRLTTADGTKLTGNYKNAVIRIFNYSMQTQKVVSILPVHGNSVQIPVSQLTPGIYRVQLMRGNETLGCSFIKE